MIPADGGGGGGLTAWEAYDIEALHTMVDGVSDAEIETSWQQVSAWTKTNELLDEHAAKLDMYRQDLVTQWPPEKNQAAAAFVGYLDNLVLALRQGSTAAANNVTALANLTSAVSTARTDVKKAYQEYTSNQGKLASYQQDLDAWTAQASQSDMPAPNPPTSPVAANRQQELTQQAQKSMAILSGAAVDSTMKMTIPPPYTPPTTALRETRQHIDGPPAAVMSPPVIPAPRTSGSGSIPKAPTMPGGIGSPTGGPGPVGTIGSGPILNGGVIAPPPPAGPAPMPPITPSPFPGMGGGPLPPGGLINPPGFGPLPGGTLPTGGGGLKPGGGGLNPTSFRSGSLPAGGGEGPLVGRGPAGARPLAPGGVIGNPPGGGGPVAGGGRGPAGAVRRANPVGGVLGQGSPSERPMGGAPGGRPMTGGSAATGQPFLASQRRGKGDREHESRTWDPDDPWAVDHGVAPVLEPGQEPTSYDPGPGVIGIDR
jgi:hypothetical protein